MKRRKSSGVFQKEKVVLTVASLLVMAALTVTGVYLYNTGREPEEEENIVDFSALEEPAPKQGKDVALAENQSAQNLTSGQEADGELDYDPYYIEQEKILNSQEVSGTAKKAENGAQGQEGTNPAGNQTQEGEETTQAADSAMTDNVGYAAVSRNDPSRSGQSETDDAADAETESAVSQEEPSLEAVAEAAPENNLHFSEEDKLSWPIVGNVLLNYSMDKTIFFPTLKQYKYNPSIVIGSTQGANVACAADGIVSRVYEDAQTGNTVVMNLGDGYELTYGQLDEVAVEEGDFVETGAFLGRVAAPTKYYTAEGTNVYFKLTKDGEPVDPLDYLG